MRPGEGKFVAARHGGRDVSSRGVLRHGHDAPGITTVTMRTELVAVLAKRAVQTDLDAHRLGPELAKITFADAHSQRDRPADCRAVDLMALRPLDG